MKFVLFAFILVTLVKIFNRIDNPLPSQTGIGSNPFYSSKKSEEIAEKKIKRGKVFNFIIIMLQLLMIGVGIFIAFKGSILGGIALTFYGLIIMRSLRFALPKGYFPFIKHN